MEPTHTPGPWHSKRGQVWSEIIRLKDGSTMSRNKVCDVAYHAVGGCDEMSANARLIAAAPDLLDALKTMAAMWNAYVRPEHYDGHAAKAFSDAVDAIRKATTGASK